MSRIKFCVRCKLSKSINDFTRNKSKLDKHNNYCKQCQKKYRENNKIKNQRYQKKYRKVNIEKFKIYKIKNKEKIKLKDKKYYQNNKVKILKYNKKWRILNKEYIKQYKNSVYQKNKNNIEYRILSSLRSRIRIAMKNGKKCRKTCELLGCSISFFREYLENKFDNRMSWSNYGIKGWHIDHIIPCSSFNLTDIEQQKKCFHYTNLQPLLAIDNIKKSNKIL